MAIIDFPIDDPERDRQKHFAPSSYEEQVVSSMLAEGVTPPSHVIMDGQRHRYGDGASKGDKPLWYKIYGDGHPAGHFGDWRKHGPEGVKWYAKNPGAAGGLTNFERAAIDARIAAREVEQVKNQKGVASGCAVIWENSEPVEGSGHPYLVAKGIQAHGARIFGPALLIPVFGLDGQIQSMQRIWPDGSKRFEKGGSMSGGMWMVGDFPTDSDSPVYIAEGFATAASIHESTGCACYIAFNASNLIDVAGAVKNAVQNTTNTGRRVVIVADNDPTGVGEKYAKKAVDTHGVEFKLIPEKGDANDFVQGCHDLKAFLEAKIDTGKQKKMRYLDVLLKDKTPIKWIVKGWIQERVLMMIHAPPSAGKTFFALDLCGHVSAGLPDWNGHKVRQGGVVFLAGEGAYGIRQRAAAWAQEHNIEQFGPFVVSDGGVDLDAEEGKAEIINEIRLLEFKPSIVVVDTLHTFFSGDENSARDARRMIVSCEEIMKECGCTVILVHHTGNDPASQERARGSSSWAGGVGMRIALVPGKEAKSPIAIKMLKAKDSDPPTPKSMTLKLVDIQGWLDEDGEQVQSLVPVISDLIALEKVDVKLEGLKKDIMDAWQDSGREFLNGKPYVTTNALSIFLKRNKQLNDYYTSKYTDMRKEKSEINYLISNGAIEQMEVGFVIVDGVMSMLCGKIAKGF